MQAPIVPGTRDSRFSKLRWVHAYGFVFGATLIQLSFTSLKENQAHLAYLLWGPLVVYLLMGSATDAMIARIGPCSSFGDQAHMVLHRSLRSGIIIGTIVAFLFDYLLH